MEQVPLLFGARLARDARGNNQLEGVLSKDWQRIAEGGFLYELKQRTDMLKAFLDKQAHERRSRLKILERPSMRCWYCGGALASWRKPFMCQCRITWSDAFSGWFVYKNPRVHEDEPPSGVAYEPSMLVDTRPLQYPWPDADSYSRDPISRVPLDEMIARIETTSCCSLCGGLLCHKPSCNRNCRYCAADKEGNHEEGCMMLVD